MMKRIICTKLVSEFLAFKIVIIYKLGNSLTIEASDIILLDQSLNNIVRSVFWGRIIYDLTRKFL